MKYTLPIAALMIMAACQTQKVPAQITKSPSAAISSPPSVVMEAPPSAAPAVGLTYQGLDGNRLATGSGDIPNIKPLDIPLDGVPTWLVAIPADEGSLWVAALEDGRMQAFHVLDGVYHRVEISPQMLPVGMPPVVVARNNSISINRFSSNDAAPFTHSVPLSGENGYAFIDRQGNLILDTGSERSSLAVDALPDARILQDGTGRLLLLSSPTSRYDHAIAGDGSEAGSVSLIDSTPPGRLLNRIDIPGGKVVEGIAPLWVDLNQDGTREIIVTISDAFEGAQIVVFNEQGELIAAGDPIGQGYRWRHQIAVAPFGPQGEIELVDVLTPHIGGVVEFFRLEGDRLVRTAQLAGYTSHVIGSRNLDMAAAADFDGDGIVELLLLSQDRRTLAALQRVPDAVQLDWEFDNGALISTNITLLDLPDGSLALGIGLDSGFLRIWHP